MKIKKILLFLTIPLFVFGKTVSFYEALDLTLKNNKELKAKKASLQDAKYTLEEAKAYDYGSLVFNENISRTNNSGYVFGMKLASREANFGDFGFSDFLTPLGMAIGGASQGQAPSDMSGLLKTQPKDLNFPDARTNFETKLTYKVPIYTGNKLTNAKKMAKLQILAQKAKFSYDKKALGLEVLKAYNGAVASKEFIKATKKAKEATSSFVNFANELFKEGLVTSIDVKQAKVYDLDIDAKIIQTQSKYELSIAYLRFLTDDNTIDDVSDFQNIDVLAKSTKDAQNEAQQNREDFKWMKLNVDTMKNKISFDSANNYPMIGAQLEYGFNDNKLNLNSDHDYYLGAIGLSYTLFDGGITSSKKQKAKIAYNKTKHYFEYMKTGIALEVEKNILTYKTKQKVLTQKRKAQNLSEEVLNQSEEMYKNHLINMSNLLMQQAKSQKANAQTIMANYELSLAAAKLKISLGKSLKLNK
jgi:outer membrane protein TolC